VAAGRYRLAQEKIRVLTKIVTPAVRSDLVFGFNEWLKAQDGVPCGQDWQTWSAALYLYALESVRQGSTPFFNDIRATGQASD